MRRRPKQVAVMAALAIAVGVATGCEERLELTDGTSAALGVSSNGWVVGTATSSDFRGTGSFVRGPDTALSTFGPAPWAITGASFLLADVNASGTAVGSHVLVEGSGRTYHVPTVVDRVNGSRFLPAEDGEALAVDDAGRVVGWRQENGSPAPVVWLPDGSVQTLGAIGVATDINASGDILVDGATDGSVVIDGDSGSRRMLAPPATVGSEDVVALNAGGDVVGTVVHRGVRRAALWPASGGGPVLLPGGDGSSEATAVDDAGGIVGSITHQGVTRAVYWQPGTHAVNDLDLLDGVGAVARDISANGWIVGEVTDADGTTTAARWDRPEPQG